MRLKIDLDVRTLLAITTAEDKKIYTFDVKIAFLLIDLEEDDLVCLLKKSL